MAPACILFSKFTGKKVQLNKVISTPIPIRTKQDNQAPKPKKIKQSCNFKPCRIEPLCIWECTVKGIEYSEIECIFVYLKVEELNLIEITALKLWKRNNCPKVSLRSSTKRSGNTNGSNGLACFYVHFTCVYISNFW